MNQHKGDTRRLDGDKTGRAYIEKKDLPVITDQNEQSYAQVLGQGHKSHKKEQRQTDKGERAKKRKHKGSLSLLSDARQRRKLVWWLGGVSRLDCREISTQMSNNICCSTQTMIPS